MIYTDCPNFFHVLDHREEETMTEVHEIDTVETPDKELLSPREQTSSHGEQKLEAFQNSLQKMLKEIEDCDLFSLEEVDGKFFTLCHPRSREKKKMIEAGPKEKSFSNLKAHIKTKTHVQKVKACKEGLSKENHHESYAKKTKLKEKSSKESE